MLAQSQSSTNAQNPLLPNEFPMVRLSNEHMVNIKHELLTCTLHKNSLFNSIPFDKKNEFVNELCQWVQSLDQSLPDTTQQLYDTYEEVKKRLEKYGVDISKLPILPNSYDQIWAYLETLYSKVVLFVYNDCQKFKFAPQGCTKQSCLKHANPNYHDYLIAQLQLLKRNPTGLCAENIYCPHFNHKTTPCNLIHVTFMKTTDIIKGFAGKKDVFQNLAQNSIKANKDLQKDDIAQIRLKIECTAKPCNRSDCYFAHNEGQKQVQELKDEVIVKQIPKKAIKECNAKPCNRSDCYFAHNEGQKQVEELKDEVIVKQIPKKAIKECTAKPCNRSDCYFAHNEGQKLSPDELKQFKKQKMAETECKKKPCTSKYCDFAHNEGQKPPVDPQKEKIKKLNHQQLVAVNCRNIANYGKCTRRDCTFIHPNDKQLIPQGCPDIDNCQGFCRYIHDKNLIQQFRLPRQQYDSHQMPMPMPMQPVQQQQPDQPKIHADYLAKTMPILNAIVEQNPNYKQHVGSTIYTFVQGLVGNQAPKITGMLIDLPICEIHAYMENYDILVQRVSEAKELLLDMH